MSAVAEQTVQHPFKRISNEVRDYVAPGFIYVDKDGTKPVNRGDRGALAVTLVANGSQGKELLQGHIGRALASQYAVENGYSEAIELEGYCAMPRIPGKSLEEVLRAGGGISPADVESMDYAITYYLRPIAT